MTHCEAHYEFFDWRVSDGLSIGVEAGLIKSDHVENMKEEDLIKLFNLQRENEYEKLEKNFQDIKRKINSFQMGSKLKDVTSLKPDFDKFLRAFEDIQKIDFFSSETGAVLYEKIKNLQSALSQISRGDLNENSKIISRNPDDYQGKIWITRPNPFIDRMATAWLVKKFIDVEGEFRFFKDEEIDPAESNLVLYDVRNGEFTHVGDMCTFEVVLKAFDIKNEAVKKIGEIVHDLDVKDDKYSTSEAKGLEDILTGIRKSGKNDVEILEKGMDIFEMLYAAFS